MLLHSRVSHSFLQYADLDSEPEDGGGEILVAADGRDRVTSLAQHLGKPGADVSVSNNCNTHCILLSFAALGTA